MTKLLKLVNLRTFAGPPVRGTIVKKGETCIFSDEVAVRLLEGGVEKEEGEFSSYWKDVTGEKANPDWDFSTYALPAVANRPKRLTPEPEEQEDEEAARPQSRQRAPMRTRTVAA